MHITVTFDPEKIVELALARATIDRLAGEAPAESEVKESAATAKKREKVATEAAEKVTAETVDEGPTAKEVEVGRAEVRAKLKEVAALEGKDKAIKILKDHGATSIGELDESKFEAVIKACG